MKKPTLLGGIADGANDQHWDMPVSMPNHCFLAELLANPKWEGDEAKGERALMLFLRDGEGVGFVKVQSPPLVLTVSGRSLDEILAGIEIALAMDKCPWQQDRNPLTGGKKKRK